MAGVSDAAGQYGKGYWAEVAQKHWLGKKKPINRVQASVIQDELWKPLSVTLHDPTHAIQALEKLRALELYLWPGFNEDCSNQHALLIAFILNAKRHQNLPTWSIFENDPERFSDLFRRFLSLLADASHGPRTRVDLLLVVISAFQSLDSGLVRKELAPLVSINIWHNLHSEATRTSLLGKHPQFKKAWKAAGKRYDAADDETRTRLRFERAWLYTLVLDFLNILYDERMRGPWYGTYCERFMELLTDLQSQFPTRRYVNTLIKDLNLLVLIGLSPMYQEEASALFRDFYVLLQHYTYFPIDDHAGRSLSTSEASEEHIAKLAQLQRTALKHFPEKLKLLALANYGSLEDREELSSHLSALTESELKGLAGSLGYMVDYPTNNKLDSGKQFLLEVLLHGHEKRRSFQQIVQDTALLPTEQSLYEASFLRNDAYNGSRPLAIPKVNLQYLTTGDFLWRSFILVRCEAFFDIRKDLEELLKRLKPERDFRTGETRFGGSSKMACQISKPAVVEVLPAKVGEQLPAEVRAEVILDVSRMNESVRGEWESLRPDDVVYLLSVKTADDSKMLTNGGTHHGPEEAAPYQCLRCAEIVTVLDENGKPIRQQKSQINGYGRRPQQRRIIVKLDAAAYLHDMAAKSKGKPDIYETVNLLVRRRGRENNFKSKLRSIQKLIASEVPLPTWLQDVFLGLGDPAGATYKNLPNALDSIDFRDTFLDWDHLQESFPKSKIQSSGDEGLEPPFVLKSSMVEDGEADVVTAAEPSKKRKRAGAEHASRKRRKGGLEQASPSEVISVSTYAPPNMGPYPADRPKTNTVRFTPAQVEAIRSGTQPGLTVIVGPPGTGKTDVATQIINNIYHNFPSERTLLVAQSNQALNQLFQKIVALDIDERHLLRLGHGEGELHVENDASFSKHGRVESFLEIGGRLLSEVTRLAASMDAPGAHGNSCETAGYFDLVYVKPAWKRFSDDMESAEITAEQLLQSFPFHYYFSNAPQPIFPPDAHKKQVTEIARGCYRHIEKIFSELEDIRPFEILRQDRTKANYLLIKEARIIAMTSTHAAMRRQEIADLGFHYDNVIMEEAAQITEIETFIPLAMQHPPKPSDASTATSAGLKRVIVCGDHLQNSPVIQNLAFRQYANLEQSLFLRLVRLGVPTILLDKQGRARPSIADLYSWRYAALGNLPTISSPEFQSANPGFAHDYQFLDVPDYKGKGEVTPSPHFVQNLGEAEYAVALFMYMRLLGYPASKISILTMYAGQRALIWDVLSHRCKGNRLFGMPRIVVTVDKYQGEQNDYIILSLVRTSSLGYLRDVRRLTVALSRARLGLYILGRRTIFEGVPELAPAFDILFNRPTDALEIVTGEMFPTTRRIDEGAGKEKVARMEGVEHLGQYVYEMTQAKIKSLQEGTEKLVVDEGMTGLTEEVVDDDVVEEEVEGDDVAEDDFDEEGDSAMLAADDQDDAAE